MQTGQAIFITSLKLTDIECHRYINLMFSSLWDGDVLLQSCLLFKDTGSHSQQYNLLVYIIHEWQMSHRFSTLTGSVIMCHFPEKISLLWLVTLVLCRHPILTNNKIKNAVKYYDL